MLGLAYVMNLSGQTISIGLWIAGAGGVLAFLSPIIGWLGVAVTGSDTSSNSISPQNLAIGAAAVGMVGQEGDLFRRVIGWRIVLLLIMCVLVYLQSTSVLSWMVV